LRPVRGALALCLAARDAGCGRIVVPAPNQGEAALAPGIEVLAATDLAGVAAHLVAGHPLPPAQSDPPVVPAVVLDLADVRGQERAKRALTIAAAGGHALLLRGAPGCGKTMLAHRLAGLLPPLGLDEALEVTRILGAVGQLPDGSGVVTARPFRAPHHTTSTAGLLGGGHPPRPGEISLAHRGVLFLDELPEFGRRSLEALRQVLEERRVVVARARATCTFPASFQLVAAANPCPCGWRGTPGRDCRCDDLAIARYARRLSGPLLDRIDLHVSVQPVAWKDLDAATAGPTTAALREKVCAAHATQRRRSGGPNSELPDGDLDALVDATAEARTLLGRAFERLRLTARAASRVLKVARTIADLAGEKQTSPGAVAEALGYRDDTEPAAS